MSKLKLRSNLHFSSIFSFPPNTQFPYGIFKIYLFIGKQSGRGEKETEKDNSSAGPLPKFSKQPGLGQADIRRHELQLSVPHGWQHGPGTIIYCLPGTFVGS